MSIDVFINDEHSFSYSADAMPRIGEELDINTWFFSTGKLVGIYKVVNVVQRISGYEADCVYSQVYLEEATE